MGIVDTVVRYVHLYMGSGKTPAMFYHIYGSTVLESL